MRRGFKRWTYNEASMGQAAASAARAHVAVAQRADACLKSNRALGIRRHLDCAANTIRFKDEIDPAAYLVG